MAAPHSPETAPRVVVIPSSVQGDVGEWPELLREQGLNPIEVPTGYRLSGRRTVGQPEGEFTRDEVARYRRMIHAAIFGADGEVTAAGLVVVKSRVAVRINAHSQRVHYFSGIDSVTGELLEELEGDERLREQRERGRVIVPSLPAIIVGTPTALSVDAEGRKPSRVRSDETLVRQVAATRLSENPPTTPKMHLRSPGLLTPPKAAGFIANLVRAYVDAQD